MVDSVPDPEQRLESVESEYPLISPRNHRCSKELEGFESYKNHY